MKNYNMFDVVRLNNGNLATILNYDKSIYKVEVVNENGVSLGIKEISDDEIEKIVYKK